MSTYEDALSSTQLSTGLSDGGGSTFPEPSLTSSFTNKAKRPSCHGTSMPYKYFNYTLSCETLLYYLP
jgi:hypothetical protein